MSEEIKHDNKVIGWICDGWYSLNIKNDESLKDCVDWLQSQQKSRIDNIYLIFTQNSNDDKQRYNNEHLSFLLNYLKCNDGLRGIGLSNRSIIPNDESFNTLFIKPIMKSIGCNPNITSLVLCRMDIFDYTLEILLQNNNSVEHVTIYECRIPSHLLSGTLTIRKGTLDSITQAFHHNHSLRSVTLDKVSNDINLSTAIIEGLTGHSCLTVIHMSCYIEYDSLFSKKLQCMIMGTKNLKKMLLYRFKFSYNVLHLFADAFWNADSNSRTTMLRLWDCTVVVGHHGIVDLLRRLLTTTTITKLEIRDEDSNKTKKEILVSDCAIINTLAKESNLTVLLLGSIEFEESGEEIIADNEVDIVENEDIDVVINEDEAREEHHNNHKASKEEFWETLTSNKKLLFLSTPPMMQNDFHYISFIQSLPKLNVRGLQLNIVFQPNDTYTCRYELSHAFKNNFSLFSFTLQVIRKLRDHVREEVIDETIFKKINWYCTRNVVLAQLSNPYKKRSHEFDELAATENIIDNVEPLPGTSWSRLLYKLKNGNTQYNYQDILRDVFMYIYQAIFQNLNCAFPQLSIANKKKEEGEGEGEEVEELSLFHEDDELEEIDNAYNQVEPLPEKLWPRFLYILKDCDAQYQHQAIFRCLNGGMLESIGKCKTKNNKSSSCNV